ncbi:hypothetical protein QEH59_12765 [Coraliomargarita sp. SDUM461004]|uniref:Class III cytochrome C family protein n=1 Tax=Thalassobacterium sedimentorum TaxID=3041258 RepID=A0ABU1AKV9_9BACT|nr:hypothetical protein [Coraliomargarita sp. SDUM461004]MDQ8195304.1 hypothetical protein [Coraliomargarita sp. SDUM461004]
MKRFLYILVPVAAIAGFVLWLSDADTTDTTQAEVVNSMQRMVNPGALSAAHAHLENNCSACHTPVKGAAAVSCVVCHANEADLLQRQPTSFHADISSCTECHREHQGRAVRPTKMDHDSLTAIGIKQLQGADADTEQSLAASRLLAWLEHTETPPETLSVSPHISQASAALNCITCHKSDDRHFELFGNSCMQCHGTESWNIPEFVHPSSASMDCAQCHQAPPSHYMMHFKKISQTVANKPKATVDQCYSCHQTTSWPDIKGAGWYKHH